MLQRILTYFNGNYFADKNNLFRIQKFGWKILGGFWIGDEEISKLQLLFFIVNCMEVLIYGIFQCWFFLINFNNLVILFDALTPFLTQVPTVLRILVFLKCRNDIKLILDYVQRTLEDGNIN